MPNLETQNSQDNCVEGGSLVITVTLTTLFCNGEQPSQWKMAKYVVFKTLKPTDKISDRVHMSVTSTRKTYRVFPGKE